MALGAAVGGSLGRGMGAFFGSALGRGFGALLDDPAVESIAAGASDNLTSVVAGLLDSALGERLEGYGIPRPPIMGGRVASGCLHAASKQFTAAVDDPDKALLNFWADGLDAASKNPPAYLTVFGIAREWERAGEAWRPLLAARLWSPARMESLLVSELLGFLTHLPENPDAGGMSWEDLKLKQSQTAQARAVPRERRRLLLDRKREALALALRGSFATVVADDERARDELATYAALFCMAAMGNGFEGAEAAVRCFRQTLGGLERAALVESLVG